MSENTNKAAVPRHRFLLRGESFIAWLGVAAAGIPQSERAVELNGALMVIAGLLLGLDIAPKGAVTVLLGSMIPTTIVGHAYWKEEAGPPRQNHLTHFLKNLGLIGGLLLVLTEKD